MQEHKIKVRLPHGCVDGTETGSFPGEVDVLEEACGI